MAKVHLETLYSMSLRPNLDVVFITQRSQVVNFNPKRSHYHTSVPVLMHPLLPISYLKTITAGLERWLRSYKHWGAAFAEHQVQFPSPTSGKTNRMAPSINIRLYMNTVPSVTLHNSTV